MLENDLELLKRFSLFDYDFIKNNTDLRYNGVWEKNNTNYISSAVKTDKYVFYENKDGCKLPLFYVKLFEYEDSGYIEFNNKPIDYDSIDGKYLAELILKLCEVDENKYKKHINELKERYIDYFQLTSFYYKEIPQDDDEICFFYYMAYIRKQQIAIEKIKTRNVCEDFKFVDEDHKRQLFLYIKDTEEINKIIIDSKKLLLQIAEYGCIKQLDNATEDIKNDKDFILNLLNAYFMVSNDLNDIIKHLPNRYKDDIDVLSFINNKKI